MYIASWSHFCQGTYAKMHFGKYSKSVNIRSATFQRPCVKGHINCRQKTKKTKILILDSSAFKYI